jgi:hypothetical protein
MSWTHRMIVALTEDAERCWERMWAASPGKARQTWEMRYNRRMFAVAYLQTRLVG